MQNITEFHGSAGNFEGTKVALVVADFNSIITSALQKGAVETLLKHGVKSSDIAVFHVPGSFEIPVTVGRVLEKGGVDGVLTLGAVIRGETAHFEYVAGPVASAIMNLSVKYNKPVIFGVLTTDTVEQAMNRAGLKSGNKGSEAASALLEVLSVFRLAGI